MANPTRISELTNAPGGLQDADQIPVARGAGASGQTYKILGSNLFAAVSAAANLNVVDSPTVDLSWSSATKTLSANLIGPVAINLGGTGATTAATARTNLGLGSLAVLNTAPGVVPIGGIIMWSGAIGSVPSGWALCNGANGTPDLRNRFIVGAGSAYAVGATGGADTVTLTTAQMPVHNHTINDPGHNHTVGSRDDFGQGGGGTLSNNNSAPDQNTPTSTRTTGITINSAGGTNGVTQAHENRPPYYALAYIMRTS